MTSALSRAGGRREGDALPLRRNRDFMLLQIGQLSGSCSNAGTQSTSIAYPLLVLAVTGSAAKAGVVAFARTVPMALFALPAGVAGIRRDVHRGLQRSQ